jgi:hypothetical protein
MSFIRTKIQIISYEFRDKCRKNKESKDTENIAQPGAGRRREERKGLTRNCKGKLMGREKRFEIYICINIQVINPYEHGNDASRHEEKEEGKCVVIVSGLSK